MSWPEAFVQGVQTVCWTFIAWRVGAFCARWFAEEHHWDQSSK